MKTIGFIGLGIMGMPMAVNLVRAAYDVVGYSRSGASALVAAGGREAASIAEATAGADLVITMLPDSPDVADVVLGRDGVLANASPNLLLADMSTISPATAREIAATAAARGIAALDAPVSGGEQGAIDAVLSIMVGGSPEDFAKAEPVLNAIGKTIVHVGPAGAGQTVKAANQLIVAVNIQALAEAVVFLEAYGVDTDAALKVLGGGLAGSKVLDQKGRKMLDRDFAPGFRLALHNKDLGIVTAAARQAGISVPLGSAVAQLVTSLVARGDGGLDHSGLFKLTTELSGRD